jgi:hypothetical protein
MPDTRLKTAVRFTALAMLAAAGVLLIITPAL